MTSEGGASTAADDGSGAKGGWPEIAVLATPETSDAIEGWLLEAGALAVTLRAAPAVREDDIGRAVLEPAPGELRLWDALMLVGLFARERADAALAGALARAAEGVGVALPDYRLSRLPERVWERVWMEEYVPMRFGPGFWLCPSHHAVPDRDAVTLRLDPGLAFGSGTHPTTAQCLEWLGRDTGRTRLPFAGQRVVDYGSGSGVLAIASLLLGAERAHAVDIDPQAIRATTENARLNGVAARLEVSPPEALAAADGTVDLLLANILLGPLEALADTFARLLRPGGTLLLSGLLEVQIESLRLRYNRAFDIAPGSSRDGWALLAATRRSSA